METMGNTDTGQDTEPGNTDTGQDTEPELKEGSLLLNYLSMPGGTLFISPLRSRR